MAQGTLNKTLDSKIQAHPKNRLNGYSHFTSRSLTHDFVENRRYHIADGGITLKLKPDLMLRLDEARGELDRSDAVGAVMEALLQGNARLIDLHSQPLSSLSDKKITESPARPLMGSASTPEPDPIPPLPTRGLRDVIEGLQSRVSSQRMRLSIGISVSLFLLGSLGVNYHFKQAIDARDQAISRLAHDSAVTEWSYLELIPALAEIETTLRGLAQDNQGLKRQSLEAMSDRISLLRDILSGPTSDKNGP